MLNTQQDLTRKIRISKRIWIVVRFMKLNESEAALKLFRKREQVIKNRTEVKFNYHVAQNRRVLDDLNFRIADFSIHSLTKIQERYVF